MHAEMLSYSRAQGAFAGIDLSGGVLRPDEDANPAVYGKGASPRTILASREISAPPDAQAFLKELDAQSAVTAAPPRDQAAVMPPTNPRTTASPTTDDNLRAKVVDIQQTLDRMLAETTPAPVGCLLPRVLRHRALCGGSTPSGLPPHWWPWLPRASPSSRPPLPAALFTLVDPDRRSR